jgi:hypothetical protein
MFEIWVPFICLQAQKIQIMLISIIFSTTPALPFSVCQRILSQHIAFQDFSFSHLLLLLLSHQCKGYEKNFC